MSQAPARQGEAAAEPKPHALSVAQTSQDVSHNLNGQRLGRKGRETRERIVRAAVEVLCEEGDEPFTLGAVARQASLGMSSLYNYFTDLSELMVAVLEPVTASASDTYIAELANRWPDSELDDRCADFWRDFAWFWSRNAAVLLQRNRMSDAGDERMLTCRVKAGLPLMDGIARQLRSGEAGIPSEEELAMANVLVTMMERTVTVQNQPNYRKYTSGTNGRGSRGLGAAGSRLLALAVRDWRASGADPN